MRNTEYPWGIPLNSLSGDDLFSVPTQYEHRPDQTINLAEKLAPYEELIEDHYGYEYSADKIFDNPKKLKEVSRYLELNPYWSECSFDEIAKIVFSDVVQSELSDLFDRSNYERHTRDFPEGRPMPEVYEFIWKLSNSLHHFGNYPASWNTLVTAYYAIPDFDFGSEFEVRFDHSPYFNIWGGGFHTRAQLRELTKNMSYEEANQYWNDNELYLDGIFAYLIFYRGKHVLTIGFSLGSDRIFLSQIQLRSPKGNRWVYRLPEDYFNYTIGKMYEHFSNFGFDLYLVDGASLAQRISSLYGGGKELDPEAYTRIATNYNQPLQDFIRGESAHRQYMTYYKLIPYTNTMRNPFDIMF